jgi:hypothetical protein
MLRPMPWPTNSRTTLNPACSTLYCISRAISDHRRPGFMFSIARTSVCFVTSSSFCTAGLIDPNAIVVAVSHEKPSTLSAKSSVTMSPSFSRRLPESRERLPRSR